MYEVTLIKVNRRTKKHLDENIRFTCDSYETYKDFFKFNFGKNLYVWSHNFSKTLVKSIIKIK